jgi:hypothetical protein
LPAVVVEAERPKTPDEAQAPKPFKPTAKMLVYLRKYLIALATTRPITARALALESGVHEDTVYGWREKPGFDEWFEEKTLADARRLWGPVVNRGMRRAERTGDPREIETMGRIIGAIKAPSPLLDTVGDRGAVIGQVNNYAINFLVPRPEVPALPGGGR